MLYTGMFDTFLPVHTITSVDSHIITSLTPIPNTINAQGDFGVFGDTSVDMYTLSIMFLEKGV